MTKRQCVSALGDKNVKAERKSEQVIKDNLSNKSGNGVTNWMLAPMMTTGSERDNLYDLKTSLNINYC